MTEDNTNTEIPEYILHVGISVFSNYKSITRMVTFLTKRCVAFLQRNAFLNFKN